MKRRVKPRRRIARIELLAQSKILLGQLCLAGGADRFAEIGTHHGAARFQCGSRLDGFERRLALMELKLRKAATEPGVAEGGVEGYGLFEGDERGEGIVIIQQHEPMQGGDLGKAGGKFKRAPQGFAGFTAVFEHHLQFRETHMSEAKFRRKAGGLLRGGEGGVQSELRLQGVGAREPFAGGVTGRGEFVGRAVATDQGDDFAEGADNRGVGTGVPKKCLGDINAANGKFEGGAEEFTGGTA